MSSRSSLATSSQQELEKESRKGRRHSGATDLYSRPLPAAQHIPRSPSGTSLSKLHGGLIEKRAVVELGSRKVDGVSTGAYNGQRLGATYGSGGGSPVKDGLEEPAETRLDDVGTNQRNSIFSISKFFLSSSLGKTLEENNNAHDQFSLAQVGDSSVESIASSRIEDPEDFRDTKTDLSSHRRSVLLRKRKSWARLNRSPERVIHSAGGDTIELASPHKSELTIAEHSATSTTGAREPQNHPVEEIANVPSTAGKAISARRPSQRRISRIFGGSQAQNSDTDSTIPTVPPVPLLPKSFSADTLPSLHRSDSPSRRLPSTQRSRSGDRLTMLRPDNSRRRDELWTVYRTLESDFQRFKSKPAASKTGVVRTCLQPFLVNYKSHPSNHKLMPEDLDRRVNILNKWWTGLLEMLSGSNSVSLGGSDRTTVLECITGLMERAEWRVPPSPFSPLTQREIPFALPHASSRISVASTSSDFLVESVRHNVRNMFVQNIISQIAFVVDRMSLKNAPAGLVEFCGKTCAYAFFFCPYVAETLVRLWNLSENTLRRVLAEFGAQRQDDLTEVSAATVSAFPPCVRPLGFITLNRAIRNLRTPSPSPLGTANVPWYGNWNERWSGRESDLLYVFAKAYHILLVDFLPSSPSKIELLCAPGYVLIHAQILTNLDMIIRRQGSQPNPEPVVGPAAVTFDDLLDEPEPNISAFSSAPINVNRSMAESRLIMLTRDFLSKKGSAFPIARHNYAEAFNSLLQAAAKGVSLYDRYGCRVLCDLLEEAVVILVRYEQVAATEPAVLDWPFWISVFKLMVKSHIIDTVNRIFILLYTIWNSIASNQARKDELCLNFLLERELFESSFNHWCPMVRAYFMRLLCWRVGRVDGEGVGEDMEIMKLLATRLLSVWSSFLHEWEDARRDGKLPQATTPSNPAARRRFIILKTNSDVGPASSALMTFDGILPSSAVMRPTNYRGHSTLLHLSSDDLRTGASPAAESEPSDTDQSGHDGKKRWNVLRNILGASKLRSKAQGQGEPAEGSTTATSTSAESAVAKPDDPRSRPAHRQYCFKFSLEPTREEHPAPITRPTAAPKLPAQAQRLMQPHLDHACRVVASQPRGSPPSSSKYAGRALAEWAIVVRECEIFFERRKQEGVPENRWVETPTLPYECTRRDRLA